MSCLGTNLSRGVVGPAFAGGKHAGSADPSAQAGSDSPPVAGLFHGPIDIDHEADCDPSLKVWAIAQALLITQPEAPKIRADDPLYDLGRHPAARLAPRRWIRLLCGSSGRCRRRRLRGRRG